MTTTTTDALDALLFIRNGFSTARWNFPDAVNSPVSAPAGIGHAVTLSYAFLAAVPSYAATYPTPISGFRPLGANEAAAAQQALDLIASVANIQFVPGSGDGAQITFGASIQSGSAAYAYAPAYGYSWNGAQIITATTESRIGGDVWLDEASRQDDLYWQAGGYGLSTLLHELGHALGLKHPFQDTTGTGTGFVLATSLDSRDHTVMSYTSAPHSVVYVPAFNHFEALTPSTLMPLDIQALQYLYGANMATAAGNTRYHWATNAELLQTVWDGGGIDTIDASNQVFSCIIDLTPGGYSSIGLRRTEAEIRAGMDLPSNIGLPADAYTGADNLAIAYGCVIENATGGSGDDQLLGNDANNRLLGGGGNDSVDGGAGRDMLDGGAGTDSLCGGDGNDVYCARAGDIVDEDDATAAGGIDTENSYVTDLTLAANVEIGRIMLRGSANLAGNGLDNTIFAGLGSNTLGGAGGSDTLSYRYGVSGTAGVSVSLASTATQATGGSGSDKVSGFENLAGSLNADRLGGDAGANVLQGLAGNDTLSGGGGDDRLVGGAGRDLMTGGAGADVFDFDALGDLGLRGTTRDVVRDFTAGVDRIDLSTLDANAGLRGNQAFTQLTVGSAFSGRFSAPGQLYFDTGTHVLWGNLDADAQADFAITLAGVTDLHMADLVA